MSGALTKAARSMNSARREMETGKSNDVRIVFVSYAHEDRLLLDSISAFLVAQGYDVWSDERVAAGQNFRVRIRQALELAMAVIVVWSEHSIDAEWVAWEADQGLKHEKLLPVAVPKLDKRDIRPPFYSLKTLDFGRDDELLKELRKLERRSLGGASSPAAGA